MTDGLIVFVRCMARLFALCLAVAGTAAAQDGKVMPRLEPGSAQRLILVSWLGAETKREFFMRLAQADKDGYFHADVEAEGKEDFGLFLYLLPNWQSAHQLPRHLIPEDVANLVADLPAGVFRFAVPMTLPKDRRFPGLFYVMPQVTPEILGCLAEDIVISVGQKFPEYTQARCTLN